jgi:hypothetical protein
MITPEFKQAIQDYSLLLGKQYPRKQILKLIGDRYLLDKSHRIMLSRGIFLFRDVEIRRSKRVASLAGRTLHVDTYNVLFSIANYLLGRMVFISNDGFIRDAGQAYDKLQTHEKFHEAIRLVMEYLSQEGPSVVNFYIDKPVTNSTLLADRLSEHIVQLPFDGQVVLCKKPDNELVKLTDGVICTSDSVIMDETPCLLADIPYGVLNSKFDLEIADLSK